MLRLPQTGANLYTSLLVMATSNVLRSSCSTGLPLTATLTSEKGVPLAVDSVQRQASATSRCCNFRVYSESSLVHNRRLRRKLTRLSGNAPGGVTHLRRTVRYPKYGPLLQRHDKTAPPPNLPLVHLPSIRTPPPPRPLWRRSKAEREMFRPCLPRKRLLHHVSVPCYSR